MAEDFYKARVRGDIERALLVGIDSKYEGYIVRPEESLDELEGLVRACGGEVVGRIVARQERPYPATYISKGKVDEIAEVCEEEEIDLIVFDVELSPRQVVNCEDAFVCKVLDRTQIILDIFARNATTREGKIAVELAQLIYLMPRLVGKGTILSRLGGGIGTRGPGETKLETDRRRIKKRISNLKRQLDLVERRKSHARQIRKRKGVFQITLVGYTNSGKSTLLNALTGANVFVSDGYFSTLDTTTRKLFLDGKGDVVVSDTVGFISKLPHTLVSAFKATLDIVREADLIINVLNGMSKRIYEQADIVDCVLCELGAGEIPRIVVINKIDIMGRNEVLSKTSLFDGSIGISAKTGENLDILVQRIKCFMPDRSIYIQKL
ncbi:MAG: GTPase HflX [bacterium]